MTNNALLIIVVLAILFSSCSTSSNESQDIASSRLVESKGVEKPLISYSLLPKEPDGSTVFDHGQLIAQIESEKHTLISFQDEMCLSIEGEGDFNNDGYNDVLIENIVACGGNCCGNSFFIISYDGQEFQMTKDIGYDFDGIDIDKKDSVFHFTIETHNIGIGNTALCEDYAETFILHGHEFKRVSIKKDNLLKAVKEIKSEDFVGKEDEELVIYLDFNNDGTEGEIRATYWERWGIIDEWIITFSDGNSYKGTAGKRIGVLASKTNGVHDMVEGCDDVLKWNGSKYVSTALYKVSAKNGLIIRDAPSGNRIGKFDYNAEVTVIEKTEVTMEVKGEGQNLKGYWYKVYHIDTKSGKSIPGYVFSGYLVPVVSSN